MSKKTQQRENQVRKWFDKPKCACYGLKSCTCPYRYARRKMMLENLHDVAESIHDIMRVCGISEFNARAAIGPIIHSFVHYDQVRKRIDHVARKKFRRKELFLHLGRKCRMNRLETQITYSIVKRAFRAFYHGTGEDGFRSAMVEEQLTHSQECVWVHAAKRTAEVFAAYEGMFLSTQKKYEEEFNSIYKQLYDRLENRVLEEISEDCSCRFCIKRTYVQMAKLTRSMYRMHDTTLVEDKKSDISVVPNGCHVTNNPHETPTCAEANSTSLPLQKTHQRICNCPRLVALPADHELPHHQNIYSSAGPYKVVWIPVTRDDQSSVESVVKPPSDRECSNECDSECDCNCEFCESTSEGFKSYCDEEIEVEGEEEDRKEPTTSFTTCYPTELSDVLLYPCTDD